MENASKAFIIAIAAIVVMILVSIGIYILNFADMSGAEAKIDQAKVANHNQKFAKYVGTGITGAQVKECMSLALSHNQNADSDIYTVTISVNSVNVIWPGIAGFSGTSISNQNLYRGRIADTRPEGTIRGITFTSM